MILTLTPPSELATQSHSDPYASYNGSEHIEIQTHSPEVVLRITWADEIGFVRPQRVYPHSHDDRTLFTIRPNLELLLILEPGALGNFSKNNWHISSPTYPSFVSGVPGELAVYYETDKGNFWSYEQPHREGMILYPEDPHNRQVSMPFEL